MGAVAAVVPVPAPVRVVPVPVRAVDDKLIMTPGDFVLPGVSVCFGDKLID